MRRSYKVAEKVRHILATHLLSHESSVAQTVALTRVTMSPDLRYATVFWEPRFTLGERGAPEKAVKGKKGRTGIDEFFERQAGKLRAVLAQDLGTKFVPELQFCRDETAERRMKTEELLRLAREKDGRTDETTG